MTSPERPPGAAAAKPAPRRVGPMFNLFTLLLVGAALCVLASAALPALLHAAGIGRMSAPPSFRGPIARGKVPHPGFPAADDDTADEGDPLPLLEGPRANDVRPPRYAEQDDAEPGEDTRPRGGMRPATVRGRTKLLVKAEEGADVAGELSAGDAVFIMKETDDWALVLRSGEEGVAMGWTKKSQLAIR